MDIPTELIIAGSNPLMTFVLLVALATVSKLWHGERSARNTEALEAAGVLSDQKILNERSVAQIEFRTFERDHYRGQLERCEKDHDQCLQRERDLLLIRRQSEK